MVGRENPVSTWYGAILFCSGEGILFHTRATVIESCEAVFPSGWRPPTPSHKSFHGSPALVRDLCVRGGGRQPRENRHPFSFTPYLPPFPQKENPFWGGNCSGRLRTSTSSRGQESSSGALLTPSSVHSRFFFPPTLTSLVQLQSTTAKRNKRDRGHVMWPLL